MQKMAVLKDQLTAKATVRQLLIRQKGGRKPN